MERVRLAGVDGPGGRGSGYAVGGRLVLTSAHVTGPVGTRVKVFHPAGGGAAQGRVVWSGTPGGRDDAALVLVHDSADWQPPTTPVRWGRAVTDRPGTPCETWGTPDVAQRSGRAVEAEQLRGRLNPGTGFVGNQHVIDLDQPAPVRRADGASPFAGLSGAAVFCDRLLTGVVAADRAHAAHARLNAVPAYALHHDPAFRAALAEWDVGPSGGLQAVEFQDLADRAQDPDRTQRLPSPAALLQARHQIVPFHGRHDLLAELTAWCRLGGFGAWLLHGPGGQGKTRLAHHLAHLLAADGWAVLWPRTTAGPDQLRDLRHAAKPLLVVLDYAETRTAQLTALLEAAADHPANTPLKLLLLARTDGDWWDHAKSATSLAEDHLHAATVRSLAPLEPDVANRPQTYRTAAHALADALPRVQGLAQRVWPSVADALQTPPLEQDGYGNALTLQMTALADLLDTAEPTDQIGSADGGSPGDEAQMVEDRLLRHERRYWHGNAVERGLEPLLSPATLETALAAAHLVGADDREQADRIWTRLPALADQARDRRDAVTAWIGALYPPAGPGRLWGGLEPDRLAERHAGRVLDAGPALAEQLLEGADDSQATQLLTVYSRAAAHPVFRSRLDSPLTDLCARYRWIVPHIVTTATRTGHPAPLIAALDSIIADPSTSLADLTALTHDLPDYSRRLNPVALRLSKVVTDRYRLLNRANPREHLPDLAEAVHAQALFLGSAGRHQESLALAEEAVRTYRRLIAADGNETLYLAGLARSLSLLARELMVAGRLDQALATAQEAEPTWRALADADPVYLFNLAAFLNSYALQLGLAGHEQQSLAVSREAVGRCRTLARSGDDEDLRALAGSLGNYSLRLVKTGHEAEGLAARREATDLYRSLASANPDAYLAEFARSLSDQANQLGSCGEREEGLAAALEGVQHFRTLAEVDGRTYLPDLARALTILAVMLEAVRRSEESLAALQEAVDTWDTVISAVGNAHLPEFAAAAGMLAGRLIECGRDEDALAAGLESVRAWNLLGASRPREFLPDLARALANRALHLGSMERHEEGLEAIQQAIGALAAAHPDTYLPDFDAEHAGDYLPDFAALLAVYADELFAVGRTGDALLAHRECVSAHRALVAAGTDPDTYLPRLAGALVRLAGRLGATGSHDEALEASREAVNLHCASASTNPDGYLLSRETPGAHLPGMAAARYIHARELAALGQVEESVEQFETAVLGYRLLVSAGLTQHLPNVATAATDLSVHLHRAGRLEESLEAIRLAVSALQTLVRKNPDAHLADYVSALDILVDRLSLAERTDECVHIGRLTVLAHRALVTTGPEHLPGLAAALDNLALGHWQAGQHPEGLAAGQEAVDLWRGLVEEDPEAHLPGLARSLKMHSIRLEDNGRQRRALAARQEATDCYRTLATTSPGTRHPHRDPPPAAHIHQEEGPPNAQDSTTAPPSTATGSAAWSTSIRSDVAANLAVDLINRANGLDALGQRAESLATAQQAVDLCRVLVRNYPDTPFPALAKALYNLSIYLGKAGRWPESLAAAQEAVDLRRALVQSDPDRHLPDLAGALNNLAASLGQVGRGQEFLAAAEEAVDHYRALVQTDPGTHRPGLAAALTNLTAGLVETERREESLTVGQESVDLCRTLARTDPDSDPSDLAWALRTLAVALTQAGRVAEGLAAAQEAVDQYRTLAETDPDTHLPDLASALNNLSPLLSDAGRLAEGLAAIREAITIRRALADTNPGLFGPDLQRSLNMAVRLEGLGP
ncbi:Tetratricopeptide repeat-containing protein [Streptomyces sp. TLI_053]|uniref:tetratricopeptide repeat protein n=1 Tax=Streptomyces sp. TLI_053 TaxID=1855352 RepID=UPI00087A1E9F|nr:tetratricopeptide repeat protein [Streptomyces sp. TLI_053]SDS59544.1 Tetratricopeptide repeat-containing protein [Streptomyces sp. TLI_053]